MFRVRVKSANTKWNIKSESIFLLINWHWITEARGATSIRYRFSSSSKLWQFIILIFIFCYYSKFTLNFLSFLCKAKEKGGWRIYKINYFYIFFYEYIFSLRRLILVLFRVNLWYQQTYIHMLWEYRVS